MTETIQTLKEDIAVLQEKLQKLEKQQQPKSPVEEAYKKVFGEYPLTDSISFDVSFDENLWFAFLRGYNCGYEGGLENSNEKLKKPVEKQSKTLTDIVYRWWGSKTLFF